MSVPEGFKVRLLRDMTRYHPLMKVGAVGTTQPPSSRSEMFKNKYLRVLFSDGLFGEPHVSDGKAQRVTMDVMSSDLEVTDERWLKWIEEERASKEAAIKDHVSRAVLKVGSRGGFVELRVEYSNGRPNDFWRSSGEARPILEDLRARGLVTEERKTHG